MDPTSPDPAQPGPSGAPRAVPTAVPPAVPSPPVPSPPEPEAPPQLAPPAPAAFRKSGLLFFASLLLLFGPGLLAQALHRAGGLAWSEVFVFLVPSLMAALGSNLRATAYLGLQRPRPAHVALGTLVGGAGFLAASSVMALWSRLVPRSWLETFDQARLFDAPLSEQVQIALVASLLAPLCEEIAFRGYLQRTLAIRRGPVVAIAGSALLFAILHLDPIRFPALLLLGVVYGWLAWRSGTIWPSVAAHAVNNGLAAALALAAGLPDSASQERPPVSAAVQALLVGGLALALLLRAFRNVAPVPPSPASFLVMRDPRDPSTRFRLRRVPPALWVTAWLGLALLGVLGVAGSRGPHPPPHRVPPPSVPGAAP